MVDLEVQTKKSLVQQKFIISLGVDHCIYVCRLCTYTQYGPIKNGCIKNQGSDFEKN